MLNQVWGKCREVKPEVVKRANIIIDMELLTVKKIEDDVWH